MRGYLRCMRLRRERWEGEIIKKCKIYQIETGSQPDFLIPLQWINEQNSHFSTETSLGTAPEEQYIVWGRKKGELRRNENIISGRGKRKTRTKNEEKCGENKKYINCISMSAREKRSEDDTENFSLLAAAAACLLKFCNIFLSMQKLLRFVLAPFDFYSFTFCVREQSLLLLLRIYWFSTQTFALPIPPTFNVREKGKNFHHPRSCCLPEPCQELTLKFHKFSHSLYEIAGPFHCRFFVIKFMVIN